MLSDTLNAAVITDLWNLISPSILPLANQFTPHPESWQKFIWWCDYILKLSLEGSPNSLTYITRLSNSELFSCTQEPHPTLCSVLHLLPNIYSLYEALNIGETSLTSKSFYKMFTSWDIFFFIWHSHFLCLIYAYYFFSFFYKLSYNERIIKGITFTNRKCTVDKFFAFIYTCITTSQIKL